MTQKERAKVWYQEHKQLTKDRARQWVKDNPEAHRETRRKRYLENLETAREKGRIKARLWRKANPEACRKIDRRSKARTAHDPVVAAKVREVKKKWRENHPECSKTEEVKASKRRWLENNPNYMREYCHKNPEKFKARNQRRRALKCGKGESFTAEQWITLKLLHHNKCLCCNRPEPLLKLLGLSLVPDHVVPLSKGGSNDISNIQPLCHAWIKGSKGGCNNHKGVKHTDFRVTAFDELLTNFPHGVLS